MPLLLVHHDSILAVEYHEELLRESAATDQPVVWDRDGECRVLPVSLVRAYLDLFDDYSKIVGLRIQAIPEAARTLYWDQALPVEEYEKLTKPGPDSGPTS